MSTAESGAKKIERLVRKEMLEDMYLTPAGLFLPADATNMVSVTEIQLPNDVRVVTCEYFTATLSGDTVTSLTMNKHQPPRYTFSTKGSIIKKKSRDFLVSTKKVDLSCELTESSAFLLEGNASDRKAERDFARGILRSLSENFERIAEHTTMSDPTHKWKEGKLIPEADLKRLFQLTSRILREEPTLLRLKPAVYVLGDLHGNFFDLMTFAQGLGLLKMPQIAPASFLFLGDYVDRGPHSIETLTWITAMKLLYPEKIFMLRGNHEFIDQNMSEGEAEDLYFRQQVEGLYGVSVGRSIVTEANRMFCYLPLAAVVDNSIFCVHGGIPRALSEKEFSKGDFLELAVDSIPRPIEAWWTQDDARVFDLVYADPASARDEMKRKKIKELPGFVSGKRGEDHLMWTRDGTKKFFRRTGLTHVIRAHECTERGVSIQHSGSVFTVFSSSGYNTDTGAAAVLIHNQKLQIIFVDNTGFHDEEESSFQERFGNRPEEEDLDADEPSDSDSDSQSESDTSEAVDSDEYNEVPEAL